MSLDPSSMSLDPRVKTIFGRPLFHWTCPAFHLWMTPVSIVALGWNEKFSVGPEKSFGQRIEFLLTDPCRPKQTSSSFASTNLDFDFLETAETTSSHFSPSMSTNQDARSPTQAINVKRPIH
ncbi:hypothetical protein TNCV_2942951 [Trichonephila clavipes]|nr:hypothetical protein TNCV_2942951 [Trichonephila clavipes]